LELRRERVYRPFREHRKIVDGLGARGIIIQDDDCAPACLDLFANKGEKILRPLRRELAKQVFFVDGAAFQDQFYVTTLSFS